MRLKGRVAVVTGAASGIGKEIARTFVREGAKVAIADLNRIEADAVAAELAGPDRRAIGITMDVTSEEQVEAGMAKVVHTFGRLGGGAANTHNVIRDLLEEVVVAAVRIPTSFIQKISDRPRLTLFCYLEGG